MDKVFLVMVFINPTDGIHMHEGWYPYEVEQGMAACQEMKREAYENLTGRLPEPFALACIEAKSQEEVIKKALGES